MPRIWLLLELGRPQLAFELAQARLARRPTDLPARLALVDALLQTGQAQRALDEAKTAIGQAPEDANSHYAQARAHARLGNLHTAIQGMREVLRLYPHSPNCLAFQAQLLFLIRDYPGSEAAAESGLAIRPEHPECLLWLMRAAEQLGHLPVSDAARERLLAAAPDSGPVHREVGKLLLHRSEPAAAAAHLAQALALEPKRAVSLVPLLRQARRWQSWPPELLRLGDYGRAPYLAGWSSIPSWFIRIICAPVAWYYTAVAKSATRHDPLFQPVTDPMRSISSAREDMPAAAAVSPGKWLAFIGFIGLLGWVSVALKLPPAGFVVVTYLLGRSLLRQQR